MNDINIVDSAISGLLDLKGDSRLNSSLGNQIDDLLSGLRFLELYARCSAKWNEALQGKKNRHFGAVKNPQIKATLGGATKDLYNAGISALETQDFRIWENLASDLLQRIERFKPQIRTDCRDLLHRSFLCRFSNFEFQKFFRNLSDSFHDLLRQKYEKAVDIKMHIQNIQDKLPFFAQICELTRNRRSSNKDSKDFNVRIQAWFYNAACLSLLYWVRDENQEEILPRMRGFLSTPEVTRIFLAVLKNLWSLSHNRLLINDGVPKLVDFLLEILQLAPPEDGIQNLHGKLMFLTTFLVDPPTAKEYTEDAASIAKEVQTLICSLSADQGKDGTAEERDILLHNFQEEMNTIKAKVSELYARIFLDSSSFDFPRINVLGFIESLRDDLREISLHMPNHQFDKMLEEDLLSLRSFLKDTLIMNMDLDEDLWTRIINVVYRVKIAVNMLSYLNDCVWYDKKFLSDVREEINLIKSAVKEIQNQQFHSIIVPSSEMKSSPILPSHANMSRKDEVVVGFKDDIQTIVDRLLSPSRELDSVSIVGMAGQGKTTLARMVYNHPHVQYHFHKRAWCCISPSYQTRNLLLDILRQITELDTNGGSTYMTEETLAQLLYKCLKGQRYLIVMDDVWNIETWDALRWSFPNDNSGSRILFTSRTHHVALYAKPHCIPHSLRLLSIEESWELLQRKLFRNGDCPQTFEEVGKQIAGHCNGLPLAIIAIAGVLLEKVDNLDRWKQVAESLDSQIARKGGTDVLELSYKHLPEFLKPCFLYFGVFQADKVIRVRRLIQLWISEGYIHKSDTRSLEDVAEEYLMDLVSRSLVVVTNRSSTGGIKACRIDSLFYEFCLAKGKEEKFLQVESGNDLFFNSTGAIYKNYRICIQSGGDGFFASNPLGPCVHSLLFVPDHTCLNKGDLFSICNFRLLHVLDLEGMEFSGYFPDEVIQLVLLRYLAIWYPHGILSIPPSIANLRNLETFRVKRDAIFGDEICFPNTMWRMKRLRHVDVGEFTASFSGDREPDEESLALDNILTFSAPSLSYGEDAKKLLRRLPKVRKLRCRFNDSCDPNQKQNRFPTLGVLSELESLNVRYVGSLFYPYAFNFPSTLKKLTLAQFMLPWNEMSTIHENLHNLEVLKLLKDAFDGKVWDMKDVKFSKLKFLKLSELNVAQWNASYRAFPRLEQFIVENCDELENIPSDIGWVLTLKKLQVRWCKRGVASSAREIEYEQRDLGNDYFEARIMDIY